MESETYLSTDSDSSNKESARTQSKQLTNITCDN